MATKIVTSLSYLMQLASELGKAKKTGNPAEIEAAQTAHDSYHALCLEHDMQFRFQGEPHD